MDAEEPQTRPPDKGENFLAGSGCALRLLFMVERARAECAPATGRATASRTANNVHPSDPATPLTPPLDFSVAYTRYRPPIRAKCQRLLGASHSAEDVVQETFIRLWKSGVGEDAEPRTVMAWLYRTCTRLAIDVLRERKRIDPREASDDAVPCGVDLAAATAARAVIARLAAAVPEDEIAVAILCRVDGLPQPEAAAVLEVSERTVRRMLERFDERTESLRKELSS
jgi:RNA polymerase sigma-70 factor (ECF subfamily)